MTADMKTTPVPESGIAPGKTETSGEQINPAANRETVPAPASQQPPGEQRQAESTAESSPPLLTAIGIQIAATHAAAKGAFFDLIMAAYKCGLLFLSAKEMKPGKFEAWFEASNFGFSKMTRCKYMRLATCLCEAGGSKPGLLLTIQPGADGQPAAFLFDELRLRTIIKSASDGRSLSELYVDWDIVKRTQGKNDRKPAPSSGAGEDESPQEVFGRWTKAMESLPSIFKRLQPEVQAALLTDLEGLLAKLRTIHQTPAHKN